MKEFDLFDVEYERCNLIRPDFRFRAEAREGHVFHALHLCKGQNQPTSDALVGQVVNGKEGGDVTIEGVSLSICAQPGWHDAGVPVIGVYHVRFPV